jgi:hypothetical protein
VSKKSSQQKNSLSSVKNKTLGKEFLCRVFFYRGIFASHSTKSFLPSARKKTLGKLFGTR